MKKTLLIFSIVLFSAVQALAQTNTYHVQVINQNDMVSPGEILQLMKDDKGFLWLLTRTKLQRYDGKIFISFSFDERCIGIQQDGDGTIWMAGTQNLYRFKNDYHGFEKVSTNIRDSARQLAICTGPGKIMYLLTKKNIFRWNKNTNLFDPAGPAAGENNNSFPFLKSTGPYLYYAGGDSQLIRYNTVSGTQSSVKVDRPNFVFLVNGDSLWVRRHIGGSLLVSFNTNTARPIEASQFPAAFNDQRFFITGSSRDLSFISLNDKGYYSFNRQSGQFSQLKLLHNGLPLNGSPPISCFYQEENGTVWFTNEEGLVHFNPGSPGIGLLRSSGLNGDSWNNNVRSFTEDRQGNIWFATGNGFSRMDPQSGAVKTWLPQFESDHYLNYSSVRSIGYSNGKIIVGQSEKGCWIFDPATGSFQKPVFESDSSKKEFEESFNNGMMQLHNGNFLVMSRTVWLLDKDNFKINRIRFKGTEPMPRAIYEDAQGRLWMAGSNGVFCYDQQFNLLAEYHDKTFGRWANAVLQLDSNHFWVASKTIFDMEILPDNKIQLKPAIPELREAHISNLYKDSLGRIWLLAEDGIYRYIVEKKLLEKFNQQDNAGQYYTSLSNSFLAGSGFLYAGSTKGINYFDPEKIGLRNDSLNVQMLNVAVNQDDSSFLINGKLASLSYLQNSLAFEFISPYIYNGGKIVYRCMLEGSDNDWQYLSHDNTVRYPSVQPGHYTFRVAASLNGKDWFESADPLSFTIEPPFWKTWWFRLLSGILLVAAAVLLFRKRIAVIKKTAAVKQQVTELEVKALRAQMNPHFIFNAMNSIQQFTLQNDVDNANGYISKFSSLLRRVLHSSNTNFISLEEEIIQLGLYLEIEKLRLGPDFVYSISTDEEIEPDAMQIPCMLIQPFVENAIKHGLGMKEGIKKLDIHFYLAGDNKLMALITDNGIGRQKAAELKILNEKLLPQESRGIQLVRERLQLLSNSDNNKDCFTITDLFDNNHQPAGTQVIIRFPGIIS